MIRNLRDSSEGCTAEVQSHSDASKWYMVVRSGEGEWRCQCPRSFIKREECKHIIEVKEELYYRAPTMSKQTLFVVPFHAGARYREAVVTATSKVDAVTKVRKHYAVLGPIEINLAGVMKTDREVVIR